MTKLKDLPVLVIDCQTTGASPRFGNLLEIAWCFCRASDINSLAKESYLIKQPGNFPIPKKIAELTGLTNDNLKGAISPSKLRKTLSRLHSAHNIEQGIAHFARFERVFLDALFQEHSEEKSFPIPLICTHEIAKRLFPELPSCSIRALGGRFGSPVDELKRSSSHVDATLLIWRVLVERLAEQGIDDRSSLREFMTRKTVPKVSVIRSFQIDKADRLSFPDSPGIYIMRDCRDKVIYVGKASSLKTRVNSYFRGKKGLKSRKNELMSLVAKIDYELSQTALEAALTECDRIKEFNPPYNMSLKQRQRKLAFYSKDFRRISSKQDSKHPLGPFPSAQVLAPLLALTSAAKNKNFKQQIMHLEIDPDLFKDALDLFQKTYCLKKKDLQNPRSLLALGLTWLRTELATAMREDSATTDPDKSDKPMVEEDFADQAEDNQKIDSENLSVEEIAEMITNCIAGSARYYWRTRILSALLNCTIRFQESGHTNTQTLHLRSGKPQFEKNEKPDSIRFCQSYTGWRELNVADYDRMSVLLMELNKISRKGGLLHFIQPTWSAPLLTWHFSSRSSNPAPQVFLPSIAADNR